MRNCLFSTEEWDLRRFLRNNPDPPEIADAQIMDCVRTAIGSKKAGHGIDSEHLSQTPAGHVPDWRIGAAYLSG